MFDASWLSGDENWDMGQRFERYLKCKSDSGVSQAGSEMAVWRRWSQGWGVCGKVQGHWKEGATEEEKVLSRKMMRHWANFARTGFPSTSAISPEIISFILCLATLWNQLCLLMFYGLGNDA
ncbi:hypothetical protein HPG69_000295 [Diceros bicornis minor]|uniref:Uncharacterized protein n=1 Tax=Diceros bicornis minor TaxID=77932 RepID=A0A7J7EVS0_DICBM|nr:hypothetical protein HPG69_000295 [Diceros bicornis minor]